MSITETKEEIGNLKKIFPFNNITKTTYPQEQLRTVIILVFIIIILYFLIFIRILFY